VNPVRHPETLAQRAAVSKDLAARLRAVMPLSNAGIAESRGKEMRREMLRFPSA
jgi:hypothetical protein